MIHDQWTTEELVAFRDACTVQQFQDGQLIVDENSEGTMLYFVDEGCAEVRKSLDKRFYKEITKLTKGAFFGEIAFLGLAARTAQVIACGPCTVLAISPEDFNQFVYDYPIVGAKIYRILTIGLAQRLITMTEEIRENFLWAIERISL